ncbi:hypothetical protein D3C80_1216480 [compost metagenome]
MERQRLFARTVDHAQGADHALKAFDRQVFGLHRDHQLLARCQCVDHQHTQQGRTVDHGIVEILPQLCQGLGNDQAQATLAGRLAFQGRQRSTGRQQRNSLIAGGQQQLPGQALRHCTVVQEQVETAVRKLIGVVPEVAGHRAMGVEIDHDHALARLSQQAG